jgi:hypothetical protein
VTAEELFGAASPAVGDALKMPLEVRVMTPSTTSTLLLLGWVLVWPAAVLGADEAPASATGAKRETQEGLGTSVNNLGLQNTLDVSWRWRLTSSPSVLRRDAHVSLGLAHTLTPSYTRLGAWAELSPLSILDIRVGLEPSAYFGTFHSLMSFDRYTDAFDNDARDARPGKWGFGTTVRAYVSPTLKMKVGALVAVAGADFEWWRSGAPGPFFYEPSRDILLKASGDRMVATQGLLLHQQDMAAGGTLGVGLIHNLTYVYDAPENKVQKLGVVAIRQFAGRRFGLREPRIGGYVSYYLNDRSKKGQLGAALGISFKLAHGGA